MQRSDTGGLDRDSSDRRKWDVYLSLGEQHDIGSSWIWISFGNKQYTELYSFRSIYTNHMVQKNGYIECLF